MNTSTKLESFSVVDGAVVGLAAAVRHGDKEIILVASDMPTLEYFWFQLSTIPLDKSKVSTVRISK